MEEKRALKTLAFFSGEKAWIATISPDGRLVEIERRGANDNAAWMKVTLVDEEIQWLCRVLMEAGGVGLSGHEVTVA